MINITYMALIYTHFFWLAMIASALNSAIVAVIAGFAAKAESGSLIALILILTIASHMISFIYFIAGRVIRSIAVRFMNKHHIHLKSKKLAKVNESVQKYRLLFILMYRFLPGIRFISPYIIGINATSFWPFFFIDWVGAFVWAVIFGVLGYLFGAATMHYMDEFSNYAKYIYLTAAVIIIFIVVKNRLIKFIQHRQESKASKSGLDVFL